MADAEKDPTPWELLRSIKAVGESVKDVGDKMLTKDRFDEYQRGTDRRFDAQEQRQSGWEAKSERAHGELDARIDAVEKAAGERAAAVEKAAADKSASIEKAAAEREKEARDGRGRVWLAIAGVVLAVILPRVWDILRGTGASP